MNGEGKLYVAFDLLCALNSHRSQDGAHFGPFGIRNHFKFLLLLNVSQTITNDHSMGPLPHLSTVFVLTLASAPTNQLTLVLKK